MPSIEEVMRHMQIPLQHISMATNEFADANLIGKGGFGNVYKGISKKLGGIAVKRLDPGQRQGEREFRIEIALLSKYKHENIVSLLGFCDEDGEKILVYKYESNRSLDKHVESKDLNWIQRLKICLDVARGLKYLHDDVGSQHRILHRDIKSSNILLNKKWKAKISDFGLSREGPVNTESSFLFSNPCGTVGYMDPDYCTNGCLSQKTDVFSFGVVLCEVLCGRLTHVRHKDEHTILSVLFQRHYKNRTLHRIVPFDLYKQISAGSLATFSNIAYQCLRIGQERPEMKHVVEKLEEALNNQLGVKRSGGKRVDDKKYSKTNKVLMKGEKTDQLKVSKGIQKESHGSVALLSPVLESPVEGPKKLDQGEPPKWEEKKDEEVEKLEEGKIAEEEAKLTGCHEKKGEESKVPPSSPPSQDVVLKVFMHCDSCVKKVRRCLIGFEGVEIVLTDPETHKAIVKGNNIDPLKIRERVQKKMGRKVELLLPVPKPPAEEDKKHEQEKPPKQKEKNHEHPSLIMSVLKVYMHCEGCVQKIKECIMKMKGVESVVSDLNNSQVVVKGTVQAVELVDHLYKKTNKIAVILKQDPEPKKKEAESGKHEQKGQ